MPILTTPEGAELYLTDWNVPVDRPSVLAGLLDYAIDWLSKAEQHGHLLDGGCIQYSTHNPHDAMWRTIDLTLRRIARDMVEITENDHFIPSQFDTPLRYGRVNGMKVVAVTRQWRTAERNGSLTKNQRQYFFHFKQELLP